MYLVTDDMKLESSSLVEMFFIALALLFVMKLFMFGFIDFFWAIRKVHASRQIGSSS